MLKISKLTPRRIAVAFVSLLTLTEVAVRFSGVTDFPVYDISNDLGYIPAPNQSGNFLNKNTWVFNNRSMGTATQWNPVGKVNVLLIGNSIVMGGNPYPQSDKLGPLIQTTLGDKYAVWPVAAGGWSTVNEAAYLEKNPDVAQAANFFVWEYMHGGLSQPSPWRGEYIFPSEKPFWATWYVARRYVLPKLFDFNMNELPPQGDTQAANVVRFEKSVATLAKATGNKTPGILFLYPGRDEYLASKQGVDYATDRKQLERIATTYNLKIIDLSRQPEWNEQRYREGTHPTVEGNKVMAEILANEIKAER